MARIPLPALADLPASVQVQLSRRPPVDLYRMASHAPALLEPFMSLVQANFTATSLTALLREAVILRVGAHHASAYEIRHHRLIARVAGLSDAGIESLLALQPPGVPFSEDVVDAVLLADALISASPVDNARVQRLISALGQRGYVELALLIGFYRMVATFIEATGLEPEPDEQLARWHAAGGR